MNPVHHSSESEDRGRVLVLDGIRGLAILLVLMTHGFGQFSAVTRTENLFKLLFVRYGWVGVDLFFVLSGFLITGILLKTKHSPDYFKSFYMRRVLRIFPLYYVTLAICFFILPLVSEWGAATFGQGQAQLPWFLTYLMNYNGHITVPLGHFWSLCVEEQFYMIWPLVVWLLARRALLGICAVVIIGTPLLRLAMSHYGADPQSLYMFSITRVDALLWGALLALLAQTDRGLQPYRKTALVTLAISGAGVLAVYVISRGFTDSVLSYTWGLFVLDLFFAALLALTVTGASHAPLTQFFSSGLLRWLGKYSYAIYVFNWPVVAFLKHIFADRHEQLPTLGGSQLPAALVFGIGSIALSCGLGLLSYHCLEKHFLKMKRLFPARGSTAKAAVVVERAVS